MQRTLALSAAWLLFLGLLTGVYVWAAMNSWAPGDARSALVAHLNALLGAFLLVSVAWSLPLLRYGQKAQRYLGWTFILANYGNWAVTLIKAWLKVRGLSFTGQPANDLVFAALLALVVAPSLAAAAAWVAGFYPRRP